MTSRGDTATLEVAMRKMFCEQAQTLIRMLQYSGKWRREHWYLGFCGLITQSKKKKLPQWKPKVLFTNWWITILRRKALIHLLSFAVVQRLAILLRILDTHCSNFGPETCYPEWGFNLWRNRKLWSTNEEVVIPFLATGTDKQDTNSTSTELCYFNF